MSVSHQSVNVFFFLYMALGPYVIRRKKWHAPGAVIFYDDKVFAFSHGNPNLTGDKGKRYITNYLVIS